MEVELMEKIFVGCLITLLTIGNVLMGCELDLDVVYNTLRRPIAPAIGFFTQFIIMPVLAYVIANLVLVERGLHLFALGLFVTGCAPPGGASNFWTLLLDGNAHLSVTMTFLSTFASLVMMPLWMNLLGYKFLDPTTTGFAIKVPYSKIFASLGGLIVPLLIGVAISRWKPEWGAKARKVLRPFVLIVLAFIIIFGTFTSYHLFAKISWPAIVAGLLLPWFGFMCGCFSAILLRQKPQDVTAIAVETGVQNTGIAIMLLKISFSGSDADAGESILMPIIVACFTPGPLLIGYCIHKIANKGKTLRQRRLQNSKVDDKSNTLVKVDLNEQNGESDIELLEEGVTIDEKEPDNVSVKSK